MTKPSSWRDYSDEVRVIQSKGVRGTLIVISGLFLALGVVGIFIPLLPTTPFVLVAAACFARSSPRFYNWLMNHAILGPPLRRWKESRSISRKHKTIALSMLALTLVPAILFLVPVLAIKILLGCIGLAVAVFISRQASEPVDRGSRLKRPDAP